MAHSQKIKNIVLRLAAVLLGLTLLSAWATGRMYARYSTTATFSDSARVAKFNISEDGTLTKEITIADMQPGQTENYQVTVTSDSEVAVYYTIAVENVYKNLPLQTTVLDENDNTLPDGRATIGVNDSTPKTYTLQVSWPESETGAAYAGMVDVLAITLTAVQVD